MPTVVQAFQINAQLQTLCNKNKQRTLSMATDKHAMRQTDKWRIQQNHTTPPDGHKQAATDRQSRTNNQTDPDQQLDKPKPTARQPETERQTATGKQTDRLDRQRDKDRHTDGRVDGQRKTDTWMDGQTEDNNKRAQQTHG